MWWGYVQWAFSANPQAIQIVAYFDEMETATALGPRASKNNKLGMRRKEQTMVISLLSWHYDYFIGAIYFMITNLEPHLRSKLDAIHLVALFECPLLERYCIDDILAPFCEDMNKLSKVRVTVETMQSWLLQHIIVNTRVNQCGSKEHY